MSGQLNVYNLASLGVNVDRNPVQLEDGELTKAQNAIHDPAGSTGSVRKRPGLVKVNTVAAAGAIKGAVGVPIVAGSAGNDGGLTPAPAVDPDTRKFFVGRRINSTTSGWNTTSDLFVASVTTGGPDGYDAAADPRVPDYMWTGMAESGTTLNKERAFRSGHPGVMFQNRFYYAGNDYTFQSTAPTIRMWDGERDFLLGRVPSNAGTVCEAVINMIVGGDNFIYFTTHDTGLISNNTLKARVFQLDPESGAIKQLGASFETIRVPFDLAWGQGRLWTRTHGAGISSTSHLVYYFRPGIDTAWTSETPEASALGSNALHHYSGRLFMAIPASAVGVAAKIIVRSAIGVYTTSLTAAIGDASPNLVSLGYANHFGAMATFGGNLYASYFNERGDEGDAGDKYARIYKFDGTTWTVVFNPAANDDSSIPYSNAVVIGGKIFFVSAPQRTSAAGLNRILYSSDGSSWTAVTTTVLDDTTTSVLGTIAS
jgi:hypothetical protein